MNAASAPFNLSKIRSAPNDRCRTTWRVFAGATLLWAALAWPVGFTRADETLDEPNPRVGEIPEGCNGNALFVEISRPQSSICVGETIPYRITIQNTAFPSCQKTNIHVRFWNPDHPPGADPCNAPAFPPDFEATIPVMNPGDPAQVYCSTFCACDVPNPPGCVIDNTVAALTYTPLTPGPKVAVVCVTATAQTGIPPDTFLATPNITTTVNALPGCAITGDGSVCSGDSTAWCAPEGQNLSYLWEGPGVDGQTSRCVNVSAAGQYCVTVTNTGTECFQRCCKQLSVTERPDCTISGGVEQVCQGQTTQWCGPEGMDSYSWTGPGGFVANTRCITIGAPGQYCLVTAKEGCPPSEPCCRTLTVDGAPPCTITGGHDQTNENDPTHWCGPLDPGLTYSWTGPNGFTSSEPCVAVVIEGEYCLTVTNAAGCKSTCCRRLTVIPCTPERLVGKVSAFVCGGGTATAVPLAFVGLGWMKRRRRVRR